MADLGYSVGVTGLKELRELETRIKSLDVLLSKPLNAESVKELSRALKQLGAASGSANAIKAELAGIKNSTDQLQNVFKNTGSALAGVFKSEMGKAAASIRNDVVLLGEKAFANVGDVTSRAMATETKKISGAAAKARAEMTAAYNKLVGEDGGLKSLNPENLGVVKFLRDQGATISKHHAQLIKNIDDSSKQTLAARKRLAASEESQTAAEAASADRQARQLGAAELRARQYLAAEREKAANQASNWRNKSAGKYTVEDFRYLVGMPSREESAAFTSALKAELESRQAQIAVNTKHRANSAGKFTEDDFRNLVGMPSRAEMDGFTASLKADLRARQASIAANTRAAVGNATANAGGSYSSLRTYQVIDPGADAAAKTARETARALRESEKAMLDTNRASGQLSAGFKQLTVTGGDLHGMSRGLASGFGALWLTWGNMLPLLAGAAISHGFMQTAKQGMEVAQSLSTIAALGIDTSTSFSEVQTQVRSLTSAMIDLGHNGPFGPMQVAEAMKTLSLAGLEATKIASVLPTVLNFSMAGDTSIQQAADVLVSVTTAFGTGAEGFERSADIIMRAAADSKASVESFGSAMKTASVVGEQFNASQEDVAVMIQYLANLGIQGTAAGTAVRNMYSDLSGRSGQTSKIIKQLGLDFRDAASGGIKPLKDVAKELYDTLKDYDAISQKNILQALLSERGGKAMIEVMAMYKKAATDASGATNQLEKDINKFAEASGQSAVAAAKMAATIQNEWKAVGASLQTTMFEAFEQMEPMLYDTAIAMQKAFSSPELRQSIAEVGMGIATITKYVAENASTIATAIEVYIKFRLALIGVNLLLQGGAAVYGLVSAGITALTAAQQAGALRAASYATTQASVAAGLTSVAQAEAMATASTVARTSGMVSFGAQALKILPVVGNVIAGAGIAWSLYDMWANKANKTTDEYVDHKANQIAKALNQESEQIEKVNRLRATGLTLMEAEARVKANNAKASIDTESVQAVAAASERQTRTLKVLADINEKIANGTANAGDERRRERAQARLDEDNAVMTKYENSRLAAQKELDAAEKRRITNAKETHRLAAEETARLMKEASNLPAGKKNWNLVDFQQGQRQGGGGGGRPQREPLEINKDGELQALRASLAARASIIEAAYGKESKFLDMRRDGEIISEAEYLRKSFELANKYEADKIAVIEEGTAALEKATWARRKIMEEGLANAKDPISAKMYQDAIDKETNELKTAQEKATADIEKIKIESNARVEQSFLKLESTAYKLIKTDKDYWGKRGRDTERAKEAKDLEKAYENINESVFSNERASYAAAKAQLEVKQATEEHIESLQKELKVQLEQLQVLKDQLVAKRAMPGASPKEIEEMEDGIKRVEGTIGRLQQTTNDAIANGMREGAEAGSRAFNDQWEKQAKEVRNTLTDAAVTALLDGGKEGGKKLRDYLQQELLRKPLTVMINGFLEGIFGSGGGGLMSMLGGLFGMGGSGGGGGGGLLGAANNGQSLYTAYGVGQAAYGGYLGNYFLSGPIASGANALGLGNAATAAGNYLNWGTTKPTLDMLLGYGGEAATTSTAAGSGAGSSGAYAGVGYAAAIVMAAAYLGGMFKEEKQVGQGVTGQLGGKLYGYQLMRESGGIFDGPDYRYVVAEQEKEKSRAEIERLKKEIADNPDDKRNDYRRAQIQKQYSRLEMLQQYDPSIEALSGPIKALDQAFRSMREGTAAQADILGLNGKGLREMTVELGLDTIHPDTGGKGLDLTGLTAEEAQKKIEAALAQANEEMARSVLGEWKEVTREVTRVVWENVPIGTENSGGDTEGQGRVAREVTETITTNEWQMSEFVRQGETAVQALARMSSSLTIANGWFETIGGTLYATSLAGGDMASQLMDAFGGADKFVEKTNAYFQAYYSEAERTAAMTAGVTKQFKAAGIAMPATREAFRALAEAQDLTTEEGRKTYAALMNLAGAADQLYTSAEQAAAAVKNLMQTLGDELLEVQGRYKELVTIQHQRKLDEIRKTGGQEAVDQQLWIWYHEAQNYLRKQEIEILKAQGKELEAVALEREMELRQIEVYGDEAVANAKKLWALQDEAKARAEQEAAVEKRRKQLFDQLTASINREKEAVTKLRDETQSLIGDMQAVIDAAANAAQELYNTIDRTAQKQTEAARETIAEILATLRAGGKGPKVDVLSNAISQSRNGLSSENFLTEYEYQRQTLILAGQLAQIGELTGESKTVEEQSLEALNAQLEQFDKTLEYYEKQLGLAADGIDATMSVGAAVAQIEAFLRGARAEDKKPATGGSGTGGTTAPKDPWGSDIYNPGSGGATVGGITPGAARNNVIGYTKDGRAVYKDGTTEKYKPGEYVYDGNQLVGTGSLNAEQWAKLQAGQEPFPGYWVNGQYNSNGKYTWDQGQNMYVPSFDTGINVLPNDTLAMLHAGEAVVPAKYNEFNPNAKSTGNDEIIGLLSSILKEASTQTGVQALSVELTEKIFDMWDDMSEGGNALRSVNMEPIEIAGTVAVKPV